MSIKYMAIVTVKTTVISSLNNWISMLTQNTIVEIICVQKKKTIIYILYILFHEYFFFRLIVYILSVSMVTEISENLISFCRTIS